MRRSTVNVSSSSSYGGSLGEGVLLRISEGSPPRPVADVWLTYEQFGRLLSGQLVTSVPADLPPERSGPCLGR